MKKIEKQKVIDYTIPEDVRECGWMAFIAYRDPKDNHRHLSVPWVVSPYIDRKDRLALARLGKYITRALNQFKRDEKARHDRKAARAKGKTSSKG